MKEWDLENPDKVRLYKRKYEQANKEALAKKRSKSEVRKAYQKKYGRINRKKISEQQKERIKQDPLLKLKKNLRNRLLRALKENYKFGSAVSDLGCSIDFLKIYLESLFLPGMTWDSYGKGSNCWSIDHIIPLSSVDLTKREDFVKVNHYSNLRPLWNKFQVAVYHKEQKRRIP